MDADRLKALEALVDELLKDRPEEATVMRHMRTAGIKDTRDPIERINEVLKALHFEEPRKEIKE